MRTIFALIFFLTGFVVLIGLGLWQMQRLEWKEGILADIAMRRAAEAVALPAQVEFPRDDYLRVLVSGESGAQALHLITSQKATGPGYRVITAFATGGRRILVDHGYVPEAQKADELASQSLNITGALFMPGEKGGLVPEANLERNIWFAREVEKMAALLDTEPVLLIAEQVQGEALATPMALAVNIPNSHLQYAITWFSLAFVWLGMTVYWLWSKARSNAK